MKDRYRRLLSSDSLQGTRVVNAAREDLGKIEEFMINVENGKVEYAVLSFGGFLGVGDKLFAIPWNALQVDEASEQMILDVSKERLEKAPGFDKDNWPDFADTSFQTSIQDYYSSDNRSHIRKVV